ncbi:RNA polymerase sigma-70 factor (ECF subfamily) [Dinghuibacter silviterrae]|uniref:RNA polymerase sigma-70 factor (ECF subfamily) n=2 Tax=Dinghuibacter silviterrae TaxID=1539049 RepID=A0A4R8DU01_9BACT|nr:RNA polymerase sigma-70 factor (ECF subfamily) [Dinghuibacter silviterrae]
MNMDTEEAYLIAEFRKGKTWAFEQVFRQFYGTICYFVQDFQVDADTSKDIVSESFIKLWGLREEFENLKAIKAFLYITARNTALNHLRRVKMMSDHQRNLVDELSQEELGDTLMQRIFDAEVLQEVYKALDTLPGQCKRVLRLTLEGLNTDDIAAAMDLSAQTVRNTRVRAMEMLRKRLAHCAVAITLLSILVEKAGL